MRIDTPSASIISSPAEQKTILLDHLKKEAIVMPMPPASAAPAGAPKMPGGAAAVPALQIHDLGRSLIEGHEVEGKRYVLPAAQRPPAPPMPKMPTLPQVPKLARAPAAPPPPTPPSAAAPAPPGPPQLTIAEVWTSVKLKTPVLTKVTSALGSQTTYCKPASTSEPHPSLFEIPPGYKLKKS
jgi:hypothetical protein